MLKKKKGFTLIELMIVVAIIGILAAVAIPAFLRFIKKSKTSEAGINLTALKNGALAWYNAEHNDANGDPLARHFPGTDSPTGLTASFSSAPDALPCTHPTLSKGALYSKNTQQWNVQPWLSLKYSVTKAHYYQYTWNQLGVNQAAVFTVSAFGDLDCDGTIFGDFQIRATVDATSGEVESSNLVIFNELE